MTSDDELPNQGIQAVLGWIKQIPLAVFALDLDGRVLAWNAALEALTGIAAAAMLGRTDVCSAFSAEPVPIAAVSLLEELNKALAQGHELPGSLCLPGEFQPPARKCQLMLSMDASVLRDAQGRACGVLQLIHDASEEQRAALRFKRLFSASPDPVWIIENNRFVDCNDAAVAMLGYTSREDLLNTHPSKLSPEFQPDGRRSFEKAEAMMALAMRNGLHRFEWVHSRADGRDFDAEVTLARLEIGGNHTIYCTWRDITERKRAEAAFRLYASVFQNSGEGILITDADNRIIAVNRALLQLTGYSEQELLGQDPHLFSAGATPRATYDELWAALETRRYWQGELWDRRKDGSVFAKWSVISANTDEQGRVVNYIAAYTDISARKDAEARANWLARHDVLTGLLNRHGLAAQLEQVFASAVRHRKSLALVFLDLDRFKLVNDTQGHHVGDQVLVEVAHRLRRGLRDSDVMSRLGGDEFVMAVGDLDQPMHVTPVLHKLEALLSEPYLIEGRRLNLTPSMGVALYPDDADSVEALMQHADTAMYHAKENGRNNTQFYSAEMGRRAANRMELERDLWRGLDQGEFCLFYQPQVCARTGRISGAEALLRWPHPQRGMVMPLDFIPVAEESGAILRLGAWALDEACRQMRQWQQDGIAPLRMAVNVSARQFRHEGLVDTVRHALARHGLPAEALTLEITESAAMERPDKAAATLAALREMGVELAIDDFGTGYSSLAYLQALPIHCLKLDRSFVLHMCSSDGDAAIAAASIALAHKLGLQVIAEGVEVECQRDALMAQDCDFLQGYFFGRPVPVSEWPACVERLRAQWGAGIATHV
jgi:diguanylate cyclase (GGDEF)-like protein/PAS domain S-box-containing protein